ncbi:MAG: hypothetical protein HYX28_03725 [Candidatus Koribacter versatilis]|uniref:Uncharacterized protein n=1 Tax=Candidatus Korobacter versatilis TaxID=658062 RepID=A0A932A711_9BACT|nr:hypothetical protein [Candidatus Koribacter versatilis]
MENKAQNLANHTRFDPPFHFFIVPVVLITSIAIAVRAFRDPNWWNLWMIVVAVAAATAVLKIRLNALRVQDRLIRLEERLRMAALLPAAMHSRIPELTDAQCIGLRFASDEELPGLVKRTLDEKLSRKDIKKAITKWRPDYSRV